MTYDSDDDLFDEEFDFVDEDDDLEDDDVEDSDLEDAEADEDEPEEVEEKKPAPKKKSRPTKAKRRPPRKKKAKADETAEESEEKADDKSDGKADDKSEPEPDPGPPTDHVVHLYEFGDYTRTIAREFTAEDAEAFAVEYNRTSEAHSRQAVSGKKGEEHALSVSQPR